jgi:hypothetical protein
VSSKAEAAREAKTAGDSISTVYKLELMKIPSETKAMNWDDYVKQVRRIFCCGLRLISSFSMASD